MNRVIAIDWSGVKIGASSKIWVAEVSDGRLRRLESGRDRREVIMHLIREASEDPNLVVGLDFSFSFPYWYAIKLGATKVEELWSLVAEQGEDWLGNCQHPFWGKPGKGKPNLRKRFRLTEEQASKPNGSNPKSVFQICGPGSVGTGSIRGMPYLARLRGEGFSIWPFHEVRTPLVMEIYPMLLTGLIKKSNHDERAYYLAKRCPEVDYTLACKAACSEDAFDAAVSAIIMNRHLDEISTLTASRDDTFDIEGRIWWPREALAAVSSSRQCADIRPDCPFCAIPMESVVAESRHALAVGDGYPISCGHTLVIPKAHAESLFDLNAEIQADVWYLVAKVRDKLRCRFSPDGFNVGVNDGSAAGQTVEHTHVHVIPRRHGDVPDPKGGIRWVLPEHASYWEQ